MNQEEEMTADERCRWLRERVRDPILILFPLRANDMAQNNVQILIRTDQGRFH
jgi:hypothetical protein